jgi:hypothetical protein
MNNANPDDIQREMEQRALRNVRGLVDKIEDIDAHDARTERRYLAGIIVGALVVLLAVAGGLWIFGKRSADTIVIDATNQKAPR